MVRVFLGSQEVASSEKSPPDDQNPQGGKPIVRYLHPDYLGSTRVITDQQGQLVQTLYYHAFGEVRYNQEVGTFNEKRKFTGHIHDNETELDYMEARYYNATWGRFLSQDPVFLGLGGSAANAALSKFLLDPQSLNSYAYARNNPLRYTDPTGMWPDVPPWLRARFDGFVDGGIKALTDFGGGVANTATNPGGAVSELTKNIATTIQDPIGTASKALDGVTKSLNDSINTIAGADGSDSYEANYQAGNVIGQITANTAIAATGIKTGLAGAGALKSGNQAFNSVDDLINSAGQLNKLTKGVKEGSVDGDINDIFNNLAEKYDAKIQKNNEGNNFFQSGNIRVDTHTSTTDQTPTIDINKGGKLYKIRVK